MTIYNIDSIAYEKKETTVLSGAFLVVASVFVLTTFCVSLLYGATPVSAATTYYVATTGNDSNSCSQAQNIGTAKRTLNNAVGCLSAGSTLYVRGGTYAEALLDNIPSGTSWSAPVTIAAYSGESVTLKPNTGASWVLHFQGPQKYIIIDGLIIDGINTNPMYDAVKITSGGGQGPAHHIRLIRSEVKNALGQGIHVSQNGADFNEFIDLNVHNNGVGGHEHGFYIITSNNLVENSTIHNNAGYGVHIYNEGGGALTNNNIIRNNKIYDNGAVEGGAGILLGSGDGNTAYNNLIYGNEAGIKVRYGTPSPSNTKVYNNTIYSNTSYGIYLGIEGSNAVVRNNILYLNGTPELQDNGVGTVLSNNLTGTNPQFVNAAAGDFHLQATSPAINTGVSTAPTVTSDFDGNARPQGSAYDIGAYEYGGTPSPSDTTPPSVPTGLTASVVSSSQINLSWAASTDNVGVTGYRVERCQGSGCTSFTQIATPTGTSYSNTALSASTAYSYRVRATDAAGNLSNYSATVSATTAASSGGTAPIAHWKLDETSGATASDSSGSGIIGTLANGPVWLPTGGRIGGALSFDGVNDNVDLGNPAVLNFGTNSFTYSLWVNVPSSAGAWDMPLYKGGASLGNIGYDMELGTGGWGAALSDGAVTKSVSFGSETLNAWTLLTVVVDRSANTVSAYKNGAPVASASLSGFGSVSSAINAVFSHATYKFKGLLDDVRLYNRALSASEVQALYAITPPSDTTPPTISSIAASGITTSGATITWTTNEASDSQVEYGTTAAYGSSTTPNSSLVTSHAMSLSGLTAGKAYHFRVHSKDAAGNAAVSSDYTFTTTTGTATAGKTYYVATTGNDSNPGTQSLPFRTISRGVKVLAPGDTLSVRGGVYAEAVHDIPSGSSWSAPVTVTAYPGETVTVQPGATGWPTIYLADRSYIVLDGLIFDGSNLGTISGFNIEIDSTSHHIRVQNSEVKNSPMSGIYTSIEAHHNEFMNLLLHNNGTTDHDHGIYIEGSDNLVEKSDIYLNSGWGVHVYSDSGAGTCNNNIVRNNRIHDNAQGPLGKGPGIILSSGNGNKAYNNLIWGNAAGIQIAYGTPTGSEVYNNTIYANRDYGIRINPEGTNSIIKNNILYQNGTGYYGTQFSNAGTGTQSSKNLTDNDPKFVNLPARDFHLQPGSPAIDQGVLVDVVTTDFDGTARPQGFAIDIGAYEYLATGTTLPCTAPFPSGSFCGDYYQSASAGQFTTLYGKIASEGNAATPFLNYNPFDTTLGQATRCGRQDLCAVRWQGNFSFNAASYTFSATTDDGMRLYIDGVLVIDKWYDQGSTTYTYTQNMTSGTHLIKVEYYENSWDAIAVVGWTQNITSGTGNTYYVATTGTDSSSCGASSSPCKGISYTYRNRASCGDTILVQSGTYTDYYAADYGIYLNKACTASAPITLKSYTLHGAIIDGQNNAVRRLGFYVDGSYNVIEGFKITNSYGTGIQIYGGGATPFADHITFRNNEVYHNGNNVPSLAEVKRAGGGGFYASESTSNILFEGNFVHDNGCKKALCDPGGRNHGHGFYISGNDNIIRNNIITNFEGYGYNGIQLASYWRPLRTTIYNNTIFSNPADGIVIWQPDPVTYGTPSVKITDLQIKNNIISTNGNGGIRFLDEAGFGAGTNNVIDKNIVYNNAGGNAILPAGYTVTNLITANPAFVNGSGTWVVDTDFRLLSTSPAINAGVSTAPTVTTDYEGIARPQGSAYDIGAYEYISTVTDTTPPVISSVSASSITTSGATITWTTNEASDSQVEYGVTTAYGSQTTLNTSMVTSHSQALPGLSSGTLYHYRVKSKDAAGNPATSGDYTFTTSAGVITDTIPPSIPTNLTATAISSSQINLSWTASTDNVGVAGYKVYRGTALLIALGNVTTYANTGLISSTSYTYAVSAYDAAGNESAQSTIASVTTAPPTVLPASVFSIGARVKTTSKLSVRATASTHGKRLCTQPAGSLGAITDGPTVNNGYTWWKINYDTRCDGWSVQNYLSLVPVSIVPITRTLANGAKGEEVTALQSFLATIGFFQDGVTGYFGRITESAVAQFQAANNLAAVGIVGPRTRALLQELMGW